MNNSIPETPTDARPLLSEVTGQGDPIVLVPGGLSGWVSWIPLARRLSEHRMVIRVQLRSIELAGSGKAFPDSYGVQTETEGLRATVDNLELERFDLAGWSHGGMVALDFAMTYPGRVRTLTLIEPAAFWILRETGYSGAELARLERNDRSLAGMPVTEDDFKRFLVRAGLGQPGDDFESHPSWAVWMQNRQVLSILGTIWDHAESLARLRALDLPILAVKGRESVPEEISVVDAIATTAPNATLLELPGDHACHLQNPDTFLAALASHMAQAALSSS